MTTISNNSLEAFKFLPQPRAQRLVRDLTVGFVRDNVYAARLADRMRRETGTRFIDWIDSIFIPAGQTVASGLADAGFVGDGRGVWRNPQGVFPRIVVHGLATTRVMIKVESVVDFLIANSLSGTIEGPALSQLRQAMIDRAGDTELWIVERHGYPDYSAAKTDLVRSLASMGQLESFRKRARDFATDDEGFVEAERLIDASIAGLGVDWTADLFFAAEREFWQRRNRAAQFQKARQDRLGLGWANHDHHTYRSSRERFGRLISIFEKLGFACRERFYAGAQAGWGAQVLEQAATGLVIFADVDLSPDELTTDFAHEGLAPRNALGTVGLWCALHGEAFLQAGMHHLECQFDFEALKQQLESVAGVKVMNPFTNFPYLKQAFTEGERWPVAPERIERLLAKGQVTQQQAEQFRANGAIGSHLENLERNDGFKGFNQTGVSDIIAKTDPRLH